MKSLQGKYHQNPDDIGFLFRFASFSYHHGGSAQHWGGGAQPMIGGGGLGHSQRDIKLRSCKQGEVGEQKSKLTFN